MDVTKPYTFIGLGAMDVTKPYTFIGFGAMDVTKPYTFIGFGATDVTKPYKFIGFGAMDVTKSYRFIGFGAMDVTKPYKNHIKTIYKPSKTAGGDREAEPSNRDERRQVPRSEFIWPACSIQKSTVCGSEADSADP
jgi:hypothetical protein